MVSIGLRLNHTHIVPHCWIPSEALACGLTIKSRKPKTVWNRILDFEWKLPRKQESK